MQIAYRLKKSSLHITVIVCVELAIRCVCTERQRGRFRSTGADLSWLLLNARPQRAEIIVLGQNISKLDAITRQQWQSIIVSKPK